MRREPARGREVRRVVLLDHTDERGEQLEVAALGGGEGDNVLDLLAGYYRRNQGGIGVLLRSPEVAAELSNWHS